jgi:hypothetical protein
MFDMMKISSFNISVRNYLLLPIQVAIFAFAVLSQHGGGSIFLLCFWLRPRPRHSRGHRPAVGIAVPAEHDELIEIACMGMTDAVRRALESD